MSLLSVISFAWVFMLPVVAGLLAWLKVEVNHSVYTVVVVGSFALVFVSGFLDDRRDRRRRFDRR
jgi:hypothetical protein